MLKNVSLLISSLASLLSMSSELLYADEVFRDERMMMIFVDNYVELSIRWYLSIDG